MLVEGFFYEKLFFWGNKTHDQRFGANFKKKHFFAEFFSKLRWLKYTTANERGKRKIVTRSLFNLSLR